MRRRAALLVAAACLVGSSGAALAADGDTAQLTGITVGSDRSLSGVLTVAATAVDAGTLSVDIGGNRLPVRTIPIAQARRATMIVVDTSGSMGASGMQTVRTAVDSFLQVVPSDVQVGLVSFSGTPSVAVPLTTDRAKVSQGMAQLTSNGETAIFDAVNLSLAQLGTEGDRSILLLSDGTDNRSSATQDQVVGAISSTGVRAQTIAFKTGSSDTAVLQSLAAAGHGSVVAADDTAAVAQAFQSAAKSLASQIRWVVQTPESVSGKQNVVLAGKAGGLAFTATSPVDVGAAPPRLGQTGDAAPAPLPAPPPVDAAVAPASVVLGLPLPVLLAAAAISVGLLLLVLVVAAPRLRSTRSVRVEAIEKYVQAQDPSAGSRSVSPSALTEGLVSIGEKVMEGRASTSATMRLLHRADLPFRAGEWWLIRIGAVIAGAAAGLVLLSGTVAVLGALVGVAVGFFGPQICLRFLARRRCRMFERQLPDVLTMVASSLATGFSLLQALDAVAHDSAEPAAKEFSRAIAEARIGSDIDQALDRLADRMQSDNMKWTSMAIRIQRQVGGNLAETLRTTATTLREREALGRQVRALSAEGKLSAYILVLLPIGIFLYSLQANYEYISLLWSNVIGYGLMAAGLISLTIGIFWMRKVVEVKV